MAGERSQSARGEGAKETSKASPDLLFSGNCQLRIEAKVENLSESVANLPTIICKEFIKQHAKSEKQLEIKSKEAHDLRLELQSVKGLKEQLEKKVKTASTYWSEVQSLKKQLENEKTYCRDKVAGLTTTIRELDEDKKKLREVILGNTVHQKISDGDIKQLFANLRQQIQALANNLSYELHPQYRLQSRADWVFEMRAVIFRTIHYFILNRDIFGLAESYSPARHDSEVRLDHALGNFEGLLRAKKVTNKFISDWRLATFKCIETFGHAPGDTSFARFDIWKILLPFHKPGQDVSKLGTDVQQLCENAFTLRLLTRQTDARYQFEIPKVGAEYDPKEGSVEAYGVIGGGEESNIIAIPFCGALMKYTVNEDTEISCVLEPAQVVVHAMESQKPSDATKDLLTDPM
ncbi:uncharacterized protein CPUR_03159 [Claviceps purpurea 20.1]|uniref:Uncharacterized protein n=1 Tax=Claviceps purpurea (strain 20.1) TaxID=1111077 RepID=M1W0H6_CLAP2|nr:uncharacterized protein CPUR_03159 [Claviceps purpurea 20.1]